MHQLLLIAFFHSPHSHVFYSLFFKPMFQPDKRCSRPESQDEGIEFAVRASTSGVYGPWVPLRLTWQGNSSIAITQIIRGYEVEGRAVTASITTQKVTLCEGDLLPVGASEIQFRWMNTVINEPGKIVMWALINATVDMINTSTRNSYRIFDSK